MDLKKQSQNNLLKNIENKVRSDLFFCDEERWITEKKSLKNQDLKIYKKYP